MAYPLLIFAWCSSLLSGTRRGRVSVPRLALLTLIAGGACYTSPINRAPTVSSIESVGDILPEQDALFTVVATDPDADPLTIGWAVSESSCPDASDRARWPKIETEGPLELQRTFKVMAPLDKPFCVWAFATDRHQAVFPFNRDFVPRNQPPVAKLALMSPDQAASYPLNTTFVFTGFGSRDPENHPISFDWTLTAPTGFTGALSPCAARDTDDYRCLHADFPGRYVVALTIQEEDSDRSASAPPLTVDVAADQPPCIDKTSPPFGSFWVGDPTRDATFSVAHVDDDGDSQELHFTWFYGGGTDTWTIVDNDFPGLNLKANTFQVGDEAEVRVEIRDRPNRVAIENALLACGTEPFCSAQAERPACFQRVTWKVKWNL